MPDRLDVATDIEAINLIFEPDESGIPILGMSEMFNSLIHVELIARTLDEDDNLYDARDSRSAIMGRPDSVDISSSSLIILNISQNSPLRLLLGLKDIPQSARRKFAALLKGVIFYDQERDYRAARAQEAWESAYEKRLRNIRTILETSKEYGGDKDLERILIKRLIDEISPGFYHRWGLTLKHVESYPEDLDV